MPAGTTYDGSTRLYWLADDDEPADLEAIDLTELGEAIDVSGYLVPDAFSPNFANDRVDGKDILSPFNNESMGRFGASPSATFKRKLADDGSEAAWTTFSTRKTRGTLVYFETLPSEADPTTGDDYIAFPCETGAPLPQNTAVNAEVRFQVDFACLSAPVYGSLVAS
jgi:hypothetical protein